MTQNGARIGAIGVRARRYGLASGFCGAIQQTQLQQPGGGYEVRLGTSRLRPGGGQGFGRSLRAETHPDQIACQKDLSLILTPG